MEPREENSCKIKKTQSCIGKSARSLYRTLKNPSHYKNDICNPYSAMKIFTGTPCMHLFCLNFTFAYSVTHSLGLLADKPKVTQVSKKV